MTMKKLIASVIAGAVAVSAMATSAFAADEIKIDQTATTKTTASVTLDVSGASTAVEGALGDLVITFAETTKTGAPTDYAKLTSVATKANAKISYIDGLTTKTVDATEVDLLADATTVTFNNAALVAGTKITKIEMTISAVKPEHFDATYAELKLATVDGQTATTAFTFADDTTIVLDNSGKFELLASEVKDAAVNGAKVKLTFKATTADKTTLKVVSSQSRKEYTVDVAKDATSAEIELPAAAFTAGATNTITITAPVTLSAATLAINEDAAETEAPDETETPDDTDENPDTGAAPVALALVPAALAAVVVAKKRK